MMNRTLLAYAVLYVVWGSTYLAMRIAVETLPPFLTGAVRFLLAGMVLLGWGLWRRQAPVSRGHLWSALTSGLLLIVGGNASVMWAMKTVPSGVGALLVATTPMWMVLLSRERTSRRTWVGIVLGLCGVGLLMNPLQSTSTGPLPLLPMFLLLFASATWAAGSLVPRRLPAHPSNAAASGLQMVCGGGALLLLAFLVGEPWSFSAVQASGRSIVAVAYLALFGSLLGFTTYGWLMRVEPPARVSTYAYVNPVVAVLLGATVAGEVLTPQMLVASSVIVLAVIIIVRRRPVERAGGGSSARSGVASSDRVDSL